MIHIKKNSYAYDYESYFNHSIILSRVTQSCMTTDKIDKETFLGCIVNLAMYLLLAFNKSLDFNE
jgi:hypothetical protein